MKNLSYLLIFSLTIIAAAACFLFKENIPASYEGQRDFFGVTFSKKFSQNLGLDWKENYLAVLDDLKVKQIRLPLYWDDVEKTNGQYDFSDYDFMIQAGEDRQAEFILAIGKRLPRWPECHLPNWAKALDEEKQEEEILNYLATAVNHYRDFESIKYWQVENEPFLNTFGECPRSDSVFLEKEISLVRSLDDRPIIITASGELSSWRRESKLGDVFGTTLYRTVWGPWTGYYHYPLPPAFYQFKAFLNKLAPEKRFVVELQGEPWAPTGRLWEMDKKELAKSFNLDDFKKNLNYSLKTRFSKTYVWGVEWWYYQLKQGDSSYWELARPVFIR